MVDNMTDKQNKEFQEEIEYLSKRYPEVSFAKLTRIAVHAARWMKKAMLDNAVEADVVVDRIGETVYLCPHTTEESGDKVKLIVVKEP